MGRSVAVILALVVMVSASVAVAPLTFNSTGAVAGSLSINITAPQQGEYLQTNYAVVSWDAVDTEHLITSFWVYLDSLAEPEIISVQEANLTGLGEGLHYVVVRAYNDVGDHAEAMVMFYINSLPPSLSIIAPSSGAMLNYSDVTVSWTASDGVGIATFDARIDEDPWITSIPANQTSNTFSDLTNGHHTATVIAHSWGGMTASATVTFSIDTTLPSVNITQPAQGEGFGHTEVSVKWVGNDAGGNIMGYQIWVDGAYTTFAAPSEDTFTLNYADGHHTVKVVVVDTANSTASDEVTFFVDTVVPNINVASPDGDKVAVGSSIVVVFTKPMDQEQTTITVNGVAGTAHWNGTSLTFIPDQKLENGRTYTVTVTGKDLLGTEITKTWTFTTVNADNPLAIYGVLAAVVGVVIVIILFYMSRMKKQEPPPSRSWKGRDELERRSRSRKWDDEDDEEDE